VKLGLQFGRTVALEDRLLARPNWQFAIHQASAGLTLSLALGLGEAVVSREKLCLLSNGIAYVDGLGDVRSHAEVTILLSSLFATRTLV